MFAWKGETLEEYWWATWQIFRWADSSDGSGSGPNLILDDGGDATLMAHKGLQFEREGAVPETAGRRLRGVADRAGAAAGRPV